LAGPDGALKRLEQDLWGGDPHANGRRDDTTLLLISRRDGSRTHAPDRAHKSAPRDVNIKELKG
ncbi:MAG: hypothetical protein AAGD14_16915, partial [Planctomycetota bacterium]